MGRYINKVGSTNFSSAKGTKKGAREYSGATLMLTINFAIAKICSAAKRLLEIKTGLSY